MEGLFAGLLLLEKECNQLERQASSQSSAQTDASSASVFCRLFGKHSKTIAHEKALLFSKYNGLSWQFQLKELQQSLGPKGHKPFFVLSTVSC